ncbi:MAG TPA: GNAT family N-acetyltransferase, partial [Flavisolibacter sp.]|nr:GNAT family N-acetyltransferase [Flavisolibacter sp.]
CKSSYYFCYMTIQIIYTGTPAYEQMIDLRMEVLLNPIGIPKTYISPEKEKQDIFIAAFEDEKVVGCCILTPINEKSIQLRQMAVKQNIQHSGIGAAIIKFAESNAKERGFNNLFMHARDAVIPFYEKQGYQIDGEGFTEVNIPHHKMKKEL